MRGRCAVGRPRKACATSTTCMTDRATGVQPDVQRVHHGAHGVHRCDVSCVAVTEVNDERRARVKMALQRRRLVGPQAGVDPAEGWMQQRFVARARALFYARMMFLTLGLAILAVPVWYTYFQFTALAFIGYFVMLTYSVFNYLALPNAKLGRVVTYVTLVLDLMMMVIVVVKPQTGGGLQNPLLGAQLIFTMLFALLYPKPLLILPPLLALPITARLDQLLDRSPTAIEVLTLMWYLGLNVIIIYVLVYLNEREVAAHREVVELQAELKDLAVVEERNRLAREIHDGLGANLSSLIIQSEYVQNLAREPALKQEIAELKGSAEDAIEELRRSLHMMREDFDLANGIEDYVRTFRDRTQLNVSFAREGQQLHRLPPEMALTLFRVLQECLSNALKHAQARQVTVLLRFSAETADLSVRDDGVGFDPQMNRSGHYGLVNLRERAAKVSGRVELTSAPGAGTTVVFSVPLHEGSP